MKDTKNRVEAYNNFKSTALTYIEQETGIILTWPELIEKATLFKDNPKGELEDNIDSILTLSGEEPEAKYIEYQINKELGLNI